MLVIHAHTNDNVRLQQWPRALSKYSKSTVDRSLPHNFKLISPNNHKLKKIQLLSMLMSWLSITTHAHQKTQ